MLTWNQLRSTLSADYSPTHESWGYAGKNYGCAIKIGTKKHALAYPIPGHRSFVASLTLHDEAVETALASEITDHVREQLRTGKKYFESRAARCKVRFKKDLTQVNHLILRMNH